VPVGARTAGGAAPALPLSVQTSARSANMRRHPASLGQRQPTIKRSPLSRRHSARLLRGRSRQIPAVIRRVTVERTKPTGRKWTARAPPTNGPVDREVRPHDAKCKRIVYQSCSDSVTFNG
jgi:hypothetical protein